MWGTDVRNRRINQTNPPAVSSFYGNCFTLQESQRSSSATPEQFEAVPQMIHYATILSASMTADGTSITSISCILPGTMTQSLKIVHRWRCFHLTDTYSQMNHGKKTSWKTRPVLTDCVCVCSTVIYSITHFKIIDILLLLLLLLIWPRPRPC